MQIKVTVGGETQFAPDNASALALAEKMGAGPGKLPVFERIGAQGVPINETGLARSLTDRQAAEAAGYATDETVYERGSQASPDAARSVRSEFEQMPLTSDGLAQAVQAVGAEHRHDLPAVPVGSVQMDATGKLVLPGGRFEPTKRAMSGLVTRLGCGGLDYLTESCTSELRAINVNRQAKAHTERELTAARAAVEAGEPMPEQTQMVARARTRDGSPEVFAIVSPKYTAFDVDRVAEQIDAAIPPACRGAVTYDAERGRLRFEAWLHTTASPETAVAGEFFRAGIVGRSDDTGAGAIEIDGGVFQNRCLNFAILGKSWQSFGGIRHIGSSIGERVEQALALAEKSLDHFREAWGYAARREAVPTAEGLQLAREISMAALFRGILKAQLVPLPGRKEERVKQLVQAWKGDSSSAVQVTGTSVAAVVNAFTQVAHTTDLDPWQQDETSKAATDLLIRKSPLPMELE